MRKIEINVDEQVLEALEKGLRPEGRLIGQQTEKKKMVISFVKYNRKARVRQQDVTIYQTDCGWIKQSAERTKMWASTSNDVGLTRGANALLAKAQEMTTFMHLLAAREGDYVAN